MSDRESERAHTAVGAFLVSDQKSDGYDIGGDKWTCWHD
jgi:hypothetical protein